MGINNTGLVFRMESMEAAAEGEVSAENTLAAEVGVSEAADQVESATGDVTEVATGIENASEAAGELGEIQGSLEEAVESGEGVSPREAEHIQARLERVAGLLGTTVGDMGLSFRKESFGGKESRLAATKMRLEFVKEWGKKIWGMIVKAWEWVKAAVGRLLESITGSAERLESRLKDLEKQVVSAKNDGKTVSTEEVKKSAALFSIGGTTSAETIKKFLANTADYHEILKGTAALVTPSVLNDLKSDADLKAHSESIAGLFAKGTMAGDLGKDAPTGAKGMILLTGNRAFASVPKKVKSGESEIEVAEVTIVKASEKAAEGYKSLSFDEMSQLLKFALNGAGKMKEFQKVKSDLEKVTAANIEYAKKMASTNASMAKSKADGDEGKKTAEANGAAIKALHDVSVKAVNLASSHLPKETFVILQGIGDVVAACLSASKDAKKD